MAASSPLHVRPETKAINAVRTSVARETGTIVAEPFKNSRKPFLATKRSSIALGASTSSGLDTRTSKASTYSSSYNQLARYHQTAGTQHKLSCPYKPDAARNRVRNEPKRLPPPFKSTLTFGGSVQDKTLYPYRTIAAVTSKPTVIPMHKRIGFTNPAIIAEYQQRMHKPVFR